MNMLSQPTWGTWNVLAILPHSNGTSRLKENSHTSLDIEKEEEFGFEKINFFLPQLQNGVSLSAKVSLKQKKASFTQCDNQKSLRKRKKKKTKKNRNYVLLKARSQKTDLDSNLFRRKMAFWFLASHRWFCFGRAFLAGNAIAFFRPISQLDPSKRPNIWRC